MQRWRGFYSSIETLLFGLSLGSVLVLAGIGLAVTFGVMGVINMAHGELMMLGAYTVYVVQQLMPNHIGASILVAIPAAFLVAGLFGVLIERGIVRYLYGRPLETLLATFGVSLVLQQLVRDVFSPNNRPVETPQWMAGSLQVNDVLGHHLQPPLHHRCSRWRVFALLLAVLKRTRLGLEVRAVSQNRKMARAMGIRTEWVDALTFGLGSGIAGVAGVALSQLTNVGPNLGQSYIVDSFMVVVFGGVGSLWGTLTAGTSLGVVEQAAGTVRRAPCSPRSWCWSFADPLHPAAAAGIVPAERPRGGGLRTCERRPPGLVPWRTRAPRSWRRAASSRCWRRGGADAGAAPGGARASAAALSRRTG